MNMWETLTYIGACTVAYCLFKLILVIHHNWKVYFAVTYPDFSKFGKWSVITGSTDGIGKATAFELASHGQNIILIARNEDKLKNAAKEIISKHGVQVKYLKIDFSEDESIYEEISKFLSDYDVGVLVNNVGMGSPSLPLLEISENIPNFTRDIIRVNITSVVQMTEIVLPGMVARRRGLIINISSMTAVKILSNIYGATKAFVHYFSQSLSYEYEEAGVLIRSCVTGPVMTNLAKDHPNAPKSIFVSPEQYAKAMLAAVDKERWTYGCWKHTVLTWLTKSFPMWIIEKQRKKVMESYRKNSKKFLKEKYS